MGMRLAAAGAVCLLAVVSAGCSGEDDKPPAAARSVQHSQPPTPAASLAPVTLPEKPGPLVELIARQVRATGTVYAELVATGGHRDQKVDEKTTAQVRTSVSPPEARLTIVDRGSVDPGSVEAVVMKGAVYTRVDGQEQAPGKPWVRISRQDAANPEIGAFAKMLTGLIDGVEKSLGEIAADTGLALVKHGSFQGAPVAEGEVRRYSGTTPVKALGNGDPALQALAKLGPKDIAWTLWVDAKGLPRRFQTDLSTSQGMKTRQVVTYSRWGEPVDIQAPPRDKVHTIGG
ncbi:hypothetical protein [Spirillospora sp. CA-294931]|uniref:hypothetical protein n=1 Tax=Spirillospora sp. CA-294931 TaxID=3240042 RepID=UPI003D8AFBA2